MAEKIFWSRTHYRSIVDHPEEVKDILIYLRRHGDLRVNAKYVELLWMQFSNRTSSDDFRPVTDIALESFGNWLDGGMDGADYGEVEEKYSKWDHKSKEHPFSTSS